MDCRPCCATTFGCTGTVSTSTTPLKRCAPDGFAGGSVGAQRGPIVVACRHVD